GHRADDLPAGRIQLGTGRHRAGPGRQLRGNLADRPGPAALAAAPSTFTHHLESSGEIAMPQGSAAHELTHRVHHLADGREAIFFADANAIAPEPAPDARALDPRGEPGQLRYDRLTGDWVAVAAHRQSRTYLPPKEECPL